MTDTHDERTSAVEDRTERVIRWIRTGYDGQEAVFAAMRVEIVVETLRYVAGWTVDMHMISVLPEIAANLEHEQFDPADDCCPLCEEMDCDEGCPLAPIRPPQWNRRPTDGRS